MHIYAITLRCVKQVCVKEPRDEEGHSDADSELEGADIPMLEDT